MGNRDNRSIIILDDIHWSKEMEGAWEYVQQHPQVTTTIDLFFIGIVFLRKEFKNKQLTENIFAIFIDAYHTQIKDDENKIKKAVIYSIISIDLKGKKELCGFLEQFRKAS